MSWLEELSATYDHCQGATQFAGGPLNPVASMYQVTHVCITLDAEGRFVRAEFDRRDRTLIPVTEASAGRSGKTPAPHPFSDKVRFCAGDFEKWTQQPSRFHDYLALLRSWCDSAYAHPKAVAVRQYVEKRTMVADLVYAGVLYTQGRSMLSAKRPRTKRNPAMDDQTDAVIRWRVEIAGDATPNAWEDATLFQSWSEFENTVFSGADAKSRKKPNAGVCQVSGQENVRLAQMHPRNIRFSSDGAKIISGNDENGFTFRGRFRNSEEACGVGFNVTQKAHNALRWLIAQRNDGGKPAEQVFLAWAIGGESIPDPQRNTGQLLLGATQKLPRLQAEANAELRFALALDTLFAGYEARLQTAEIVVMGLDSATPGRMAITFHRKIAGLEFLGRMQAWHERFAWVQAYAADKSAESASSPARSPGFVGAPSPREIAEAACGPRAQGLLGEKLIRATVERLLPCVVDGRPFLNDILEACVRRTVNRTGFRDRRVTSLKEFEREREWKKVLGITCGLYKGVQSQEGYQMSLEQNRMSRDYLFGRMLAIAENIETHALDLGDERRDTNAARSMQRFASRPCSTWRHIELALEPYRARLRRQCPDVLQARERLLDSVIGSLKGEEFLREEKLTGEFLLGYHCQRADLSRETEAKTADELMENGKVEWAYSEKKLILQ